jgi:hypothetical protein
MTNRMLARLGVIYGTPESHDPAAYLVEVGKMLAKYSDRTLDAAADLLLSRHRSMRFPTPAQCVGACEDVLEIEAGKQPTETAPKHPEWSAEAIAIADRLIVSDLGRQAADEGWITQLHDHCRNARRLPTARQIADMKREARLFEEAYSSCVAGKGGTFNDALKRLGDSFLAKRTRLAEKAHGVVE